MDHYQDLLDDFIEGTRCILGPSLTGIYLHGSAVMGCFHPRKSDIDLLVVTKAGIPDGTKRRYMDMVVELNARAPEKGIELSIVREDVCRPFVYPTPFELHFSMTHLDWYLSDPQDYVEKMRGTDKDLAAHFTILYHRGKALYGKEIKEVFDQVSQADYLDSIRNDIENAEQEIIDAPVYIILNLCRVLAYKREGLVLSKLEGGQWGLANLPKPYALPIQSALQEYQTGIPGAFEEQSAKSYARYMLAEISS